MVYVASMATETTVPIEETVTRTRTTRVIGGEPMSEARQRRQFRAVLRDAWNATVNAGRRAAGATRRGLSRIGGWLREGVFGIGRGIKWVGNRLYWSGRSVGRGIGRMMRFFGRSGLRLFRGTTRFLGRTMAWTSRFLSSLLRDTLFTGFATVFVVAVILVVIAAGIAKVHDMYQSRVHEPVRSWTAKTPSSEPRATEMVQDAADKFSSKVDDLKEKAEAKASAKASTATPEPHGATVVEPVAAETTEPIVVETTETVEHHKVEEMNFDDAAATMQEGDEEVTRLLADVDQEGNLALETFLRGVTEEGLEDVKVEETSVEKTNLDGSKTKFTQVKVESGGETITVNIPESGEVFDSMQGLNAQDGDIPNWQIPLDLPEPVTELQNYYELMMMRYSKLPLPVEPEPGFWLGKRFDDKKMARGWSYWQGRYFCLQLWVRLGDEILQANAATKYWTAKRSQLASQHLFQIPREAEWTYDEKAMHEGFMSEYNRIIKAIEWRNTARAEGKIGDDFTFGTMPEVEAAEERTQKSRTRGRQTATAGTARGPRGGRSGNPAKRP